MKRMPKPKKKITPFKIGRRIMATKKKRFICADGPYQSEHLYLITGRTTTFNVHGQTGYYANNNAGNLLYWHKVK